MHYVMGDIHNDITKLNKVLKQINITKDDELIVLGDVFDRGEKMPIRSAYTVHFPDYRENAAGSGAIMMSGWQTIFWNILQLPRENAKN